MYCFLFAARHCSVVPLFVNRIWVSISLLPGIVNGSSRKMVDCNVHKGSSILPGGGAKQINEINAGKVDTWSATVATKFRFDLPELSKKGGLHNNRGEKQRTCGCCRLANVGYVPSVATGRDAIPRKMQATLVPGFGESEFVRQMPPAASHEVLLLKKGRCAIFQLSTTSGAREYRCETGADLPL